MLRSSMHVLDAEWISYARSGIVAAIDPDAEHRIRLQAHVIGQVDSDGGVRDRCRSRVLESSLMLHLLRARGLYPSVQRSIVGYLAARAGMPGAGRGGNLLVALETALVDTLLGARRGNRAAALDFLAAFDHFTSPRKQFMFHTLLSELGVIDADEKFDLDAVSYSDHASWVNLEMCALKVLRAYQVDRPGLATEADRRYVTDTLADASARGVFEANVFAHLVALLAVRRVEPGSALVGRGITVLLRCQNPDGGFPFIAGWETFLTAVAGLALDASGAPAALTARTGRFVAAHQGPDGGWPYTPGVTQSDADCSPYCLELLRAAGAREFAGRIGKAEAYLLALVNADGGFGTYRHGDGSEVGVTGSAGSALAPSRDQCAAVLDAAVAFLLSRQLPDGTFERGWSLSNTNAIFRALFALRHYPLTPPVPLRDRIRDALDVARHGLRAAQNPDGGWGQRTGEASDVLSTSYALLAATACDAPGELPARALAYLLGEQESDGGFTSIPDSAGPRPIPHDAPLLADAFALLAFSHTLGPVPQLA